MPQDSTKLAQLHDIVYPEPVSWMPQTLGWYIVLGFIIVLVLWITYRIYKNRKVNRYRKEALFQLDLIKNELSIPERRETAISQLPILVKRTVLSWAPREKVASLYGRQWLEFLDSTYKTGTFMSSHGEQLNNLAFRKPEKESVDSTFNDKLLDTISDWIKNHKQIEINGEGS